MILSHKEVVNVNTSSFLTGILIGAAATSMISKNKGNGPVSQMADKAKDKVMDFATMGMINNGSDLNSVFNHNAAQGSSSSSMSPTYSKESNMSMVKDFIRSNPDVKVEVDMILKETNTVIPGL
jgi:ABC-type glycerol-3-phosphate transport system substrate-binding protein